MSGSRRAALPLGAGVPPEVAEAIVAETSQGIWAVDADDRTTFVNGRMAELVGAKPEEMLGAPLYDFLDSASGESTREALERRRKGVAEYREIELRRRDGTTLHAFIESIPILDEIGGYAGAVAMVTDITQRKLVDREVGMLAALVRSSSDAIVACSLDGTIQSWNPSAQALFGWSANEMVGRSLAVVLQAGAEG